jgi:hypothetical protein
MKQIRGNVFETNSSSTHSITMCMKSDYDKWVAGELVWDRWDENLVEITPEIKASMENDDGDYLTYEQFNDYEYIEYETFRTTFKTPNNEEVISFGYYGESY